MSLKLLLGITGGIAAYKTPNLIRLFKKKGWDVQVVTTPNAYQFVTEATLQTVSENPVISSLYDSWDQIPHLSQREATCFLIAPCTATTLSKCANGQSDNCVTATYLSYTGPVFIAPSMHTEMYEHPSTQRQLNQLKSDGVHIINPSYGELACGDIGAGRLPDESEIINVIDKSLFGKLHNQHIVVTAGGTEEKIDAVRCISNQSSGQLGHSIANLASQMGASVSLITSKSLPTHPNINIIKSKSSQDMHDALKKTITPTSHLIMAAAISDFTIKPSQNKLKRQEGLQLNLIPTEDILKDLGSRKSDTQTFIGFCLEDQDLINVGLEKKKKKNCDFMVCNSSKSIGSDVRSFSVIDPKNNITPYSNLSVEESAKTILELL